MSDLETTFKAASQEIQRLINRRRSNWRLTSVMEFEDVSSIILAHIWQKWSTYDPSQPLDKWVNTVATNQINNLMRNHLYKHSRPCVAANSYGACCVYNTGGDGCKWTKTNPKGSGSGIQDASCWAYAKWLKKKKAKLAVSTPLSTEHHANELCSKPDMLLSEERVEAAKDVIDTNIQRRLTKEEYRIYILLYVKHLTLKDAAKKMGFKDINGNESKAYLRVRTASIKIEEVATQLLAEFGVFR